jgi:hypothetical protein
MGAEVICLNHEGEVCDAVVARVAVDVVDVHSLRDGTVVRHPHHAMEPLATALKIAATPVIAQAAELLNRPSNDGDHAQS